MLASLATSKYNGPNNISVRMLNTTAMSIKGLATSLLNLCLWLGRVLSNSPKW